MLLWGVIVLSVCVCISIERNGAQFQVSIFSGKTKLNYIRFNQSWQREWFLVSFVLFMLWFFDLMQVVQYQVSPQATIANDVPQHYVPPPPYFGNSLILISCKKNCVVKIKKKIKKYYSYFFLYNFKNEIVELN